MVGHRSSSSLIFRPCTRADLPTLAHLAVLGFAQSDIHNCILPLRSQYPEQSYWFVLNLYKKRFIQKDVQIQLATDALTGDIVGMAIWQISGDCDIAREWANSERWWFPVEKQLLDLEAKHFRYLLDRMTDHAAMNAFRAALQNNLAGVSTCLHLMVLVVSPRHERRGIGKALLQYGYDIARREKIPIALESTAAGKGLYLKEGWKIVNHIVIESRTAKKLEIPVMLWEFEEGSFVESDGKGGWRLKILDPAVQKHDIDLPK